MAFRHSLQRDPVTGRGVSVVMPVRDQAEVMAEAAGEIVGVLEGWQRPYELIVVDDGSTDGTRRVAEELAGSNRRVRVLGHERAEGYGAALRTGFQAAKYPLVLQMDGGREYVAAELERLLGPIDGVDIVCGARDRPQVGRGGGGLGRWLFRRLVRLVFAVPVDDFDCAYRLFRRAAVRRLTIQSSGRFANAEVLAKAVFLGMLIEMVPVSSRCGGGVEGGWPAEPVKAMAADALRLFRHPQFVAGAGSARRGGGH